MTDHDKPMSMVERCARALRRKELERAGIVRELEFRTDMEWPMCSDLARTAISAMREVSKEMFLAGDIAKENAIDHGYDSDADGNRHDYTTLSSDIVSKIYTAMIDAALTDPK